MSDGHSVMRWCNGNCVPRSSCEPPVWDYNVSGTNRRYTNWSVGAVSSRDLGGWVLDAAEEPLSLIHI